MFKEKINSIAIEIFHASLIIFLISIFTCVFLKTPIYIVSNVAWIILCSIILVILTE